MEISNKEPEKKESTFKQLLGKHNTTVIAIILSIAAMLGSSIDHKQQKADDAEQEIQERREYLETEAQSLDDEREQLELEYDSSTAKFAEIDEDLKSRYDSLMALEEETVQVEKERELVLEEIETQNTMSNTADIMFQIAVLLSSIGLTSKQKKLSLIASLLTVVGVVVIVAMYFV